MRRLVWVGLFGFLCVISGCGPRAPVVSAGAEPEAAQEPWAEAFSTEATGGLLAGDGADDALRSALGESCQAAALTPDGRLAQLAEALARESAAGGRTPDAAQVAYHARRLGLLEPTPQLWLGNASNTAAVEAALRGAVQSAAQSGGVTHCGGAAIRGGYGVVVVVAFVRRLLTLDAPIPSALAPVRRSRWRAGWRPVTRTPRSPPRIRTARSSVWSWARAPPFSAACSCRKLAATRWSSWRTAPRA
ncbi:MAG TPA: hypothetical protein VFZ61_14005 [Polyangiales bacterium]